MRKIYTWTLGLLVLLSLAVGTSVADVNDKVIVDTQKMLIFEDGRSSDGSILDITIYQSYANDMTWIEVFYRDGTTGEVYFGEEISAFDDERINILNSGNKASFSAQGFILGDTTADINLNWKAVDKPLITTELYNYVTEDGYLDEVVTLKREVLLTGSINGVDFGEVDAGTFIPSESFIGIKQITTLWLW